MAKFRGVVYGYKADNSSTTEASRLGAAGMTTECNAWDLGVQVQAGIDSEGKEQFEVWITGGSNGSKKRKMIGTLTESGFGYAPPSSR